MIIRQFLSIILLVFLTGCAVMKIDVDKELQTVTALEGTDTVVLGVSVDKKGAPRDGVKELILLPGQKVVYAGPKDFTVFFKDKKTPVTQVEIRSEGGLVIVDIPKDIFERKDLLEEGRKNGFLRFDYGIRVGDRELDPPMIIKRPGNP
ncbi:hypothetical protein [Cellvibrio japonicus]|uniref:Putative lipoprotein n=1 Tax=Cellvibrio japonicus (strain Ueda107) TaxID=498211 RepID=B3PG64_CELJU|nr:hypothetical protein [Cellvibrio japonicus]ACE85147.1 putative lipoprotein [Cellvibrio japonicus Ueda107]QEI13739.1 hypothetical protein FY117_16980 [Cellvibrio japonicus]QEI17313.1 hypothetical protein FY116_16985 [Cellvibrio japonicus]QEI20890.1 hypothetical protein FY115_16980 [Cellvibrio japonicus]